MDLNSDSPQASTTWVETETTDSAIPTADLSKGEQVIALESSIQDETGFDYASLSFRNSNDPNGNSIHLDVSEWNSLVKGNTQNGDYISLLNIPGSTSTGTYELANFNLRDDADNSTYLHRSTTSTYIGGAMEMMEPGSRALTRTNWVSGRMKTLKLSQAWESTPTT